MNLIGPALLAFTLAAAITWLELVTSKYPRTLSLIKNCWCLRVYALVYGFLSFIVMLTFGWLTQTKALSLGESSFPNRWILAVAIGLSTKALLHIRLFTVTVGTQTIPVGIETIVQTFEPTLLQCIEIHEFNALRNFLDVRAHKYDDLDYVRAKIGSELPPALAESDRKSFELDLNNATSPIEALELYFRRFGKASLERVFDLKMEPTLNQACDIELTSPGPGQCEVQDDGWVKGTATIPNHRFLWVLLGVEEMPGWWWPQGGGPATIKEDGSWEAHVHFGQPGEKGKFEILVLVVDSRTNNFFEKWYEATHRGNYSPTSLPKPIEDYPSSRLTVEKK